METSWPKRTTIYLHRDKDSNWDMQEKLGLTDEAMRTFQYCGMEVEIHIEVNQNGTYKVLSCDET